MWRVIKSGRAVDSGTVPHCVALPMVARCGMQESKAEVMKWASVLDGEGRASRMRKGMVTGVSGGLVGYRMGVGVRGKRFVFKERVESYEYRSGWG
jgi:hypothetical protein